MTNSKDYILSCSQTITDRCGMLPMEHGNLNFIQESKCIDPVFNTLRPRQKDVISQTTFSNAFSWMKMFEYRLKFHWNVFRGVQLTISQHWCRYWLGAGQATSHHLDQWCLDYRRIYVSLDLNELTEKQHLTRTDGRVITVCIYCDYFDNWLSLN